MKLESRSRALNPKSAYNAITRAFQEHEAEIRESASIQI